MDLIRWLILSSFLAMPKSSSRFFLRVSIFRSCDNQLANNSTIRTFEDNTNQKWNDDNKCTWVHWLRNRKSVECGFHLRDSWRVCFAYFFQVGFSSEQSWNRKVSTPSIDNSLIPPLTLQSTSESGLLLAIGIWNIWKRNEKYGLHDMMFTFRTKSRRSTWYDVYVSKIYMIRRNETQKYLGPMTIISIIIGCVCLDLIRGFQFP